MDQVETCTAYFSISKQMLWSEVDADVLEETAKHLLKEANSKLNSSLRSSDAFQGLIRTIKNFLSTCPLILQLRHPSMRPRHWKLLQVGAGSLGVGLASGFFFFLQNVAYASNVWEWGTSVRVFACACVRAACSVRG